jgi:hypothetical protein
LSRLAKNGRGSLRTRFFPPVRSIKAYTDTLVHQMESEDVAVIALRFVSGALGTISATTGAYGGVTTRIEICGNQGSAIIENDQLRYLHLERTEQEAVGAYGAEETRSSQAASGEEWPMIPQLSVPTPTRCKSPICCVPSAKMGRRWSTGMPRVILSKLFWEPMKQLGLVRRPFSHDSFFCIR